MKRALAGLALLLLAGSSQLRAWGPNGHRIVGRIAMNHLSEEADRAVECLIGPENLDQVSTWPDDIRSDPNWRKADPWHYISIDDGETLETTERAAGGDVLEAMQRFEAVLRDAQASRQAKQEALKFLVHLVGDVHQPLHVGRRADRGGNGVEVMWFTEKTNLHSVWDSHLIEHEKLSFSEFAAFIDHPTLEEIRLWQSVPYADWIRESKAERDKVYKIGDGNLSWQYAFENTPLVKRRLVQAGVRLAGLLNSIFAQATPPTPTPGH
jgi:hypothetical protein